MSGSQYSRGGAPLDFQGGYRDSSGSLGGASLGVYGPSDLEDLRGALWEMIRLEREILRVMEDILRLLVGGDVVLP